MQTPTKIILVGLFLTALAIAPFIKVGYEPDLVVDKGGVSDDVISEIEAYSPLENVSYKMPLWEKIVMSPAINHANKVSYEKEKDGSITRSYHFSQPPYGGGFLESVFTKKNGSWSEERRYSALDTY